jgi:hypothetical protein
MRMSCNQKSASCAAVAAHMSLRAGAQSLADNGFMTQAARARFEALGNDFGVSNLQ